MIVFILTIVLFFSVVVNGFDSSVKPVLNKMTKDVIHLPTNLISSWIIVTQVLFPMNSIIAARKAGFSLKESLPVCAILLGVILGMISDIKE